jgi:hypothetical protein
MLHVVLQMFICTLQRGYSLKRFQNQILTELQAEITR